MNRPVDPRTKRFLCAIADTRPQECDCTECTALVGELAETQRRGGALTAALESAVQHLSVCPECLEEYEALERCLREPPTT